MAQKSLSQGHSQQKACRYIATLTAELSVCKDQQHWKQPKGQEITVHEQAVVAPYSGLHADRRRSKLCTTLQSGSTTTSQSECKKSAHSRLPQTQSSETERISHEERGYLRAAAQEEMRRTFWGAGKVLLSDVIIVYTAGHLQYVCSWMRNLSFNRKCHRILFGLQGTQ